MSKITLESVVIVTNRFGSVATVRFSEPREDKIISSSSKPVLYTLVEKQIKRTLNG